MVFDKSVFNKVLFVGSDCENHRGGIGAVLESYKIILPVFNFIPTYQELDSNFKKSIYFLSQALKIYKELKSKPELEIVHMHGAHKGSMYRKWMIYLIAKKILNRKVVYHLHSSSFDIFYKNSNLLQKKIIQHFIKNVDQLICVSSSWKDFYESNFNPKILSYVNNIVIPPNNTYIKEKSSIIKLLFLGRIGSRKGIFDLLEVILENKIKFEGKIILFVGGDGESDRLINFISEKKLDNLVKYVGWISGENKQELLAKSDIYILPSYNEGLPVSILESLSFGMPIISTNIGGIPEVVFSGKNGYLFQPGDKISMANSINNFIENPLLIEQFGKESLQIVYPFFPDSVESQLINCYKKMYIL